VGCAAEGQAGVRAVILYPRGRVSALQERQLTCWGDIVQAIEVDGDFDACQRLVKAAFSDSPLSREHQLTSANSINIGRLLPQFAYSAWAAAQVRAKTGESPGFIVPSGNLGHGFAVLLARALGWPVGPVVLATNANRTIKDWHDSGQARPRASVATLANAMDVGDPSNLERVMALSPEARDVRVELVTDEEIKSRIRAEYDQKRYAWCPHSATAVEAWLRLKDRHDRPWIAAATAHPYKFADTVEPLIGHSIEPTPALKAIEGRPTTKIRIGPSLDSLAAALREHAAAA
jgi:threonine synthase